MLLPLTAFGAPQDEALCGKFSVKDVSPYIEDKNNQLTIVMTDALVTAKKMAMPKNTFLLKNLFRNELASYFIKRENWSPLGVRVVGMETYTVKCSGVDNYVLWVSQSNVTVTRLEKNNKQSESQIDVVGDFGSFGSESGFEGFK